MLTKISRAARKSGVVFYTYWSHDLHIWHSDLKKLPAWVWIIGYMLMKYEGYSFICVRVLLFYTHIHTHTQSCISRKSRTLLYNPILHLYCSLCCWTLTFFGMPHRICTRGTNRGRIVRSEDVLFPFVITPAQVLGMYVYTHTHTIPAQTTLWGHPLCLSFVLLFSNPHHSVHENVVGTLKCPHNYGVVRHLRTYGDVSVPTTRR